MVGVRGLSGGPRPGAGRPKSDETYVELEPFDGPEGPAEFLQAVMNANEIDIKLRISAAKALLQSNKTVGKKELLANAAKIAGAGKFAPSAPPKLVAVTT